MDNPDKLTRRRKTKQKHSTICVEHHYAQAYTNNVNNTRAFIHTLGGKDEPNIVLMRCGNPNGHLNTKLRT